MKKTLNLGISVIMLIFVFTLTSPVGASINEFARHDFSEDFFAVEVDLYPDPENPLVLKDLTDSTAMTDEDTAYPTEDVDFFMAYMNSSGIETTFSAVEKVEHDIKFRHLLDERVATSLDYIGGFEDELNTVIFHINATVPFQQLVQHYVTPDWMGQDDVFVTNNFMTLMAYSSSPDDRVIGPEDEIYIGYTISVQELIDALNEVLVEKYEIGHFNVESSFMKKTDGTFEFGIKYTNVFVLWQGIKVALKGIDIFGDPEYIQNEVPCTPWGDIGGIVFGEEIHAASVLDYLEFKYEFKTQEFEGVNKYVEGTVTTHYNIGEINFLALAEDTIPTANWNNTQPPFRAAPEYTVEIPENLRGVTLFGLPLSFPDSVTIKLRELSFYLGTDAKARIRMQNGFGLTVVTATTTFGVDVEDETYEDNTDVDETINVQMGGNTYFFTDFTGKKSYKLKGLDDLWGISPTDDHEALIIPFDPSEWDAEDVAEGYFTVEFALAYGFTTFLSWQLGIFELPWTAYVYMDWVLYYTFTGFPEWYGGEILHDPTFSAIAAISVPPTTTTTMEPTKPQSSITPPTLSRTTRSTTSTKTTTSKTFITTVSVPTMFPGFTVVPILLSLLVAITILSRRRI